MFWAWISHLRRQIDNDVNVFGERADGIAPHLDFQSLEYASAERQLALEASVGLGQVKVVRAG